MARIGGRFPLRSTVQSLMLTKGKAQGGWKVATGASWVRREHCRCSRMLRTNNCVCVALWITLASANVWGEASCVSMLTRSNNACEQAIPLVIILPADQKAAVVNMRLGWNPAASSSSADEPMVFEFDMTKDARSRELIHAQLWIAALASAMAWQQPWGAAHWTVRDVPTVEDTATEAALAVALISTASNVAFPKDATIIGSLYPDGSLGPAPQILKRIEAAAAAGLKRVVAPNLQRFEVSSSGSFVNVRDFAQSRHIECLFVDHVVEATETILQRGLPTLPEIHATPHYEGALFNLLDQRCKRELEAIQPTLKDWPRKPEQLAALKPPQQELWKEVFQNHDSGLDAYRAGMVYVAWERMNEANAKLRAIAAWSARKGDFDAKAENSKATELRQKIVAHMKHPPMDQNELQSALVLAEEDHWLYEINARVEGAQILARQAFASHSHADARQKELVRVLLQNAVAEAEYRLQDLDHYPYIEQAIRRQQPIRIQSRASLWLTQLTSTFLAAAEFLTHGLKLHANEYREALLFDPRLATHARVLRDAHTEWEEGIKRQIRRQETAQPVAVKVGFVPGSAYAPPVPPVPPPPPQSLSDAARALTWIDKYCEVSALEQKYLGPGGVFKPSSLEWKNQNRATFQSILQDADVGARRGIAFAQRARVDPAILILIYERASHLRSSGEDENRLEALQQFWRCSLLGNMCWQLSAGANKIEGTGVASGSTVPGSSNAAQISPAGQPAPSVATNTESAIPLAPPPMNLAPAEAPPPSVRALPLTPEELSRLENSNP